MALGLGIGTFGLRGTDAPITGSTATIPSLDLRFAQDQEFTVDAANPGSCLISSIKGPDANFSRLSGATQVGADGLIEYAPENLLLNSAVLATQSVTASAVQYTLSFLGAGTVTLSGAHAAVVAGTGTTRKEYTFTATAGSLTLTVAGSVTEAQLERHSSARTYLPTTSAPVYGPRFDYDPVTLECKGLLIEEQRTNECLFSEQFDVWSSSGPTVTSNFTQSPDGKTTADRLVIPATSGGSYNIVYLNLPQATSLNRVNSVWLKGATGTEIVWLMWTPDGGNYMRTQCVLSTEWTRFQVPYLSSAGGGPNYFQIGVDSRDVTGGQSSSDTQTIYVWGAQQEIGTSASSYIPTTSAAVTRSADVCSISGADFASFYNQSEGTVVSRTSAVVDADDKMIYSIDNGSYAQRVQALLLDSHINLFSANVTDQVNENIAGLLVDTALAVSMKLNDWGLCMNGGSIIADASAAMPVVSDLKIGRDAFGNSPFNGHIARLTYYPKRLSDAKIQTLTAP